MKSSPHVDMQPIQNGIDISLEQEREVLGVTAIQPPYITRYGEPVCEICRRPLSGHGCCRGHFEDIFN
jgi:hypothetical protein